MQLRSRCRSRRPRVRRHQSMTYRRFERRDPITQENHWFSDPDHLSLNGAQLFSKRVAEELQRIE